MNKSQPSQQQIKPQIPPKPTNNNFTPTNDKNKKFINNNNKVIWDCGSTLYDSFELNSFRKQLDSAIVNSSRTLSMPRLPSENRRTEVVPPSQPLQQSSKKPTTSSKLSRSFQKLLRSVFRAPKPEKNNKSGYGSPDPWFFDSPVSSYDEGKSSGEKVIDGGGKYYVVYEKTDVKGLSTIHEVPEVNVSPHIGSSLVRKTMSERFTAASIGIHCA